MSSDVGAGIEPKKITPWVDFLTSFPPGRMCTVYNPIVEGDPGADQLTLPDLTLECEACDGPRSFCDFNPRKGKLRTTQFSHCFRYICVNCRKTEKLIAVQINCEKPDSPDYREIMVVKIGEWPPFGPRTPSKVIELVGPDRDAFFKGRRCETQGLGIGAYSYYRRVVEKQRNRFLDKVIHVVQQTGANAPTLDTLRKAKDETQFKKAMDMIKDVIPDALRLNGHNPFTLLHDALSDGIHNRTDEECLDVAHGVRIVLFSLAERLDSLLKDDSELKAAVSKLQHAKTRPAAES